MNGQVARTVAAGFAGIAHPVGFASAVGRAEDLYLVALFSKPEIRVRQFAPPKADRPPRCIGDGRVRDYDRNTLAPRGVHNVGSRKLIILSSLQFTEKVLLGATYFEVLYLPNGKSIGGGKRCGIEAID